jgi:Alpha-2,8-polysialyltransferase (POLYST)
VSVRFVVLGTALQATTTAAALATAGAVDGADDERVTIGILTEAFELGQPSGLDVVKALLPELDTTVIYTQPQLQALIDTGWGRSVDATDPTSPVEVWSANPTGYLTRHLLRAYPTATLSLTEDGLATQMLHFDRATRWPNPHGLGLRQYPVRLRKHGIHLLRASLFGLRRREAHRLARVFHLLPPPTIRGGPPVELVPLAEASVRDALEPLAAFFSADALTIHGGPDPVVVLGQVFSDRAERTAPGSIAEPDHPRAYLELMQRLTDAGFDVLWKAHPRDRHGMRLLRAAQPSTLELPFRELDVGAAPMEVVIMRNPEVPVIGMGSASLVYGRRLFGAPTFRMRHARYRGGLGDVVAAALPDEQALLDGRGR